MIRTSISCLLVGIAMICNAQLPLGEKAYADSLTRILKAPVSDSVKAYTCFKLIYYWMPRDSAKAQAYLDTGKSLSKSYPMLYAISFAQEGFLYFQNNAAKSEEAYRKSDSLLSAFDTKQALSARANIWKNIATFRQREDDERAFINIMLNKAIPLTTQSRDTASAGSFYVSIAVSFMNLRDYVHAEQYLDKAIGLLSAVNTEQSRLVSAYNRAGENYILQKKYDKAKEILTKLKAILDPHPDSEMLWGYYLVQGMYLHATGQYEEAIASYDKGIASASGVSKNYRLQELNLNKLKSLISAHRYDETLRIARQMLTDEETTAFAQGKADLYKAIMEGNAGKGNMKAAYEWSQKYTALNDSINEDKMRNDVLAVERKFNTAENEKKITDLKNANERASLSARNIRMVNILLISASIFLLIITVLALLFYRNNKKLSAQRDFNHQQQLKEMEQEQQIRFSEAILRGEEKERARLAGDLHDGLGGMLAAVKMNLADCSPNTGNAEPEINKVIGQLDRSINELRRIARNLMPEVLLKFGLETALKDLCSSLITENTSISLQTLDIDPSISQSSQVTVYRIVQELLTNAIKHAGAKEILVQCSQNGHTMFITLEDNGKGFDPRVAVNAEGIGLRNVKNRVDYLKGSFQIESQIHEGTTINIELNVT